jgi:hypothetical protein
MIGCLNSSTVGVLYLGYAVLIKKQTTHYILTALGSSH